MYDVTLKPSPATAMQGFSLIELLVVLMIVGLISSLVIVTLPGAGSAGRPGEKEAGQLAGLFRLGSAEAVIRATPMALSVQREESRSGRVSLHWLTWQEGRWSAADMKVFPIPENVDMQWRKPQQRQTADMSNMTDMVPDVVFYPTGEMTDFEIQLGDMTVQLGRFGKVLVSAESSIGATGPGV